MIAESWRDEGRLAKPGIVATVMSNLGLERRLRSLGLTLERTAVGDRYVIERMREKGFNVGGEQSGHIVLSDYATTATAWWRRCRCWRLCIESASRRPKSAGGSSRCRKFCATSVSTAASRSSIPGGEGDRGGDRPARRPRGDL